MKIFKRNINLGRKVPVIDTPDLRDKCVTTDKLADGSVTTNKIADGAITREKIADKAITNLDNVVQEAQDTADHPTLVGEDNYVYFWNKQTHSYNKTSIYVRGEGFHVSKTFDSVADMEAYTGTDLKEGDFVLIQSTPDDPDNAKLYTYSGTQGIYNYLIKMSGAIGFTGKTPQFSIGSIITIEPTEQASASLSPDGTDSDGNPKYKLNLALPKGEKGTSDFVIVDDHSGAGDDPNKIYIPSANAEKENATAIANEVTRATSAEQTNATAIAAEETRAKAAEQVNATAIANEVTRARAAEQENATAIGGIEGKIPTQATVQNKLADKDFVNSSISTATANFKGTYNNIADLQAVVGADANDYGFIVTTDAAGNTVYKKYKYVTGTGWAFEYVLNNSSFTAEQWATIQSGMTAALKDKLVDLPTSQEIFQQINTEATARASADSVINATIGTDSASNTIKGRIKVLEDAIGTGGSIDSRIADAKSEIKGSATSACDTLGEAEALIFDEKTRAQGVESTLQTNINTEAIRAQAAEADRYIKSETYTKEEVHNLITTPSQEYMSVSATSQTTSVTDVLPATGTTNTTYRVGNWDGTQYNDFVFSEYAWNGSTYIKLSTKSQIGEVYDISANHADTKYADLTAALGTNGVNIPQSLQKGGMSVKFVQSSDNKYIQVRCMAQNFTTDVTQWQGVDDVPTAGSDNLVKSRGVYSRFEKLVNGKTIDLGIYIFDPLTTTDGYYLQAPSSVGSPLIAIESTDVCYSDYIPVTTGQTYHYTGGANNRIFLLNENKNYVGAYILTQQDFTFEISNANAKYIQINIPLSYKDSTEVSYVKEDASMIDYNQVDGAPDLDSFKAEILNNVDNKVKDKVSSNGKIISIEKNIFNVTAITEGYYIIAPSSIGGDLVPVESANYFYSDYISINTGDTFTYKGESGIRIFFLDENKKYLSYITVNNTEYTYTISRSGVKYLVFWASIVNKNNTFIYTNKEVEMIDYNQVDGIVNKNKLVLSNGNFTTIDYNIFNKETITENAYLQLVAIGSPLQVAESEGLAYSAPISISTNVLYTYKGASGNIRIFALDKNLNVVQYLTTSGGDFSFSNNSIKYIQFWFSLSKLNDTFITQKEQRGNIEYKQIDNIPDSIIKTIVLNANPTNFRSILESAVGGNYNNRYRIQVPNGTYDIYSMFTTEEIEDNDFRGLWVGPFVEIVGVGSPDKTIFTCYREVFSSQCSPFNLDVTASISNVTILSDNCRYAVHDDWTLENWTGESMETDERYWFTAFTKGFVRVCKNLIVQSSNSAYGPAFGCGIHNGANWIYDHCVFKGSVDGGFAYACHNSQDTAISANVTLVNCRADGYKFRFGSLNTGAGSLCYAHLIGNKAIGVDLIEENPVTLGAGIKWSVDGYANTFSNEDITIYNTDSEDYSDRKDLI